ncbi:MAG: alpha/beta fold hydrolase [Oligoflexus sp.]
MDREKQGTVNSFDGTPIWFRQIGNQGPYMVLCDGVGCEGYVWKYVIRDFASDYRLLHFNYRGHGKTPMPRDKGNIGIEVNVRDLAAILNHLKVREPIILVGHSMGVQVVLEFYKQFPKKVQALIALTGPYGQALATLYNSPVPNLVFPTVKKLFETYPQVTRTIWRNLINTEIGIQYAMRFELNRHLLKREDFSPYLRDLSRMDPFAFLSSLEAAAKHDAASYLPHIKVPTLIIAGEKDRFTPYWVGEKMAEKIPGAEFLALPTASHTGPLELPDLVNLRMEKFLNQLKKPKTAVRRKKASNKSAEKN